jgi:hypothetical protein
MLLSIAPDPDPTLSDGIAIVVDHKVQPKQVLQVPWSMGVDYVQVTAGRKVEIVGQRQQRSQGKQDEGVQLQVSSSQAASIIDSPRQTRALRLDELPAQSIRRPERAYKVRHLA